MVYTLNAVYLKGQKTWKIIFTWSHYFFLYILTLVMGTGGKFLNNRLYRNFEAFNSMVYLLGIYLMKFSRLQLGLFSLHKSFDLAFNSSANIRMCSFKPTENLLFTSFEKRKNMFLVSTALMASQAFLRVSIIESYCRSKLVLCFFNPNPHWV